MTKHYISPVTEGPCLVCGTKSPGWFCAQHEWQGSPQWERFVAAPHGHSIRGTMLADYVKQLREEQLNQTDTAVPFSAAKRRPLSR